MIDVVLQTNHCSKPTHEQCYKLLNLRISKHLKTEWSEWRVSTTPLHFCTKFTLQNTEEELEICFIIKTDKKMWKQRKPRHWRVALGQPRFHVSQGPQVAVSRNFSRKINFILKNIYFVFRNPDKVYMQNFSQISTPACSNWSDIYVLSVLINWVSLV